MIISKSSQYAIRVLVYMVNHSQTNKPVFTINQITKNITAPAAFTARLINKMVKSQFISSIKGPGGGIFINNETGLKTILDVVKLIDDSSTETACFMGLDLCNAKNPCPIHYEFLEARKDLWKLLAETTIDFLAQKINTNPKLYRLGLVS